MPQQQHNINALKEAQVQLALQALKQDANLSQRRAAAIYNVPQATLSKRRAGQPSRAGRARIWPSAGRYGCYG
ncbi:hypothetical protein OPT61_g8008 [Boeremia exigua]|uniref:Uncharacterized protein n=1 Tax=Boeremia exigua TaxID=749465 RepID=A0ACC2I0K6_9PLEO|nr:hypothetical protein OPT61_g8008 [Boeremia exigua]